MSSQPILDGRLIRERRRDLGLSHRALAKRLGVSGVVISGIETDTNHSAISLGFLETLAVALAVKPIWLFKPQPVDHANSIPLDDARLVAAVGALLATTDALIAVDAIAEALNVTIDQVEDAIDRLDGHLQAAGLTVHRLGRDVALRPAAVVNRRQLRTLLRRHLARRGMNLTEASVLAAVVDGTLDEPRLGNAETVALNRLRNAGFVSRSTPPSTTEDVKSGLMLEHAGEDR